MRKKTIVCTIVSRNYLGYAVAFYSSFIQHHPEQNVVVLVVDEPDESWIANEYPFEIVYVKDLLIEDFNQVAFQFDVLELNTNVKPTFLKYLLHRENVEKVIYLDPDIYFYHPLDIVVDLLDDYSMVLTPHILMPVQDSFKPAEQDFLRTGVFNLGFIALRHSDETFSMLNWWEKRCLTLGYHEIPSGLFVDQKWMNLVPCLYSSVYILKHSGCNMAYWNLHERVLAQDDQGDWIVNNHDKLIFFHFSGIVADCEEVISKYQNRFSFTDRPDLVDIFAQYRQQLQINNKQNNLMQWNYSYGYFSNGKPIPLMTRRIFGKLRNKFAGVDPFDADGPFYHWAEQQGLIGADKITPKYTLLTYNEHDWRLGIIHKALLMIMRMVGVDRYTLLMQYLAYITTLRNQSMLFKVDDFKRCSKK